MTTENTDPKTEPTTEPKAEPQAPTVDWKAEAAKQAAEVEKFKAADAKRKAEAKKADDDKRAADGEAKKLYEEKAKELEAERARAETLEAAARKRIEATIAKLPDAAQKRIALVKDSLPLDKLGELVDVEFEEFGGGSAPPAANPKTKQTGDGKRKLSQRAYDELDRLGVSPATAERDVKVQETDLGGQVFVMPIKNLIAKLTGIAVKSRPLSSDQYNAEHK